ncbi:hypothetical protein ACROSR_20440 [Roseovarius tibetensis]|uniref:hypothetical protein n=1 Tax=Roseovarius tibetensis TaxID=2685897 RepID=UPI003D7F66DA
MRCCLAFLIFFGSAQILCAESFGLRITIPSSSLPSGDLNARLQYALERPSDDFVPISDGATLKNAQRNDYRQFIFRFDNLHFPDGVSRGFFWGEVTDTSGEILHRIPLTAFSEEDLNDRRLMVQTVAAQPIGLDALAASYPIYLADMNFLDEKNVLFSLQAVRALIDAGFVASDREWQRIFDKFTANVGFFQRGGAEDVGLILRYLHERYEILAGTDASIDAYSDFYLRFLSQLAELKIGGLAAPDGTTLAQYTVGRQRQIIGEQGVAVLDEVMNAQAILIEQQNPAPCMQLSQAMLVELNADEAFWSDIASRPEAEKSIKVFFKRFVDCAQRHYVDNGPDSASLGLLKDGFAFLFETDSFGEQVVTAFYAAVLKLEERGLFLRQNRSGQFRQVYVYYDEYLERLGQ